jgi:hypothetical protein
MGVWLLQGKWEMMTIFITPYLTCSLSAAISCILLVRHSTIDRIQKSCLVIGHKLAQFKGSYSLRAVDGLFLIVFLAIYFYSFSYYIFPGVTMNLHCWQSYPGQWHLCHCMVLFITWRAQMFSYWQRPFIRVNRLI